MRFIGRQAQDRIGKNFILHTLSYLLSPTFPPHSLNLPNSGWDVENKFNLKVNPELMHPNRAGVAWFI
jgi:hypothetical protein